MCEGEIHYSDNESIWDNMRQFTSPVVVSSIQGEDTSAARSQRTSSGVAASLACPPTDAAATQSSIQECQVVKYVSSGISLYIVFVLWLRHARYIQRGVIVSVAAAKTGDDKSCFSVKDVYLKKMAA